MKKIIFDLDKNSIKCDEFPNLNMKLCMYSNYKYIELHLDNREYRLDVTFSSNRIIEKNVDSLIDVLYIENKWEFKRTIMWISYWLEKNKGIFETVNFLQKKNIKTGLIIDIIDEYLS